MKPASHPSGLGTTNVGAGFCTVVDCVAVRLTSFVETVGSTDYWWGERLFTPNADAIMVGLRHGSSYRPLHSH